MVRVIGIGDNVVDKYLHLGLMFPGGNSVNVPVFMAKSGAQAAYLGYFGSDIAGSHLQEVLKNEGIDLSHAKVKEGENGYAVVNLVQGERIFVTDAGSDGVSLGITLSDDDLSYIKTFELIHTSIYSEIDENLPLLHETSIPISYDFSEIDAIGEHEKALAYVDFAFFSGSGKSKEELSKFLKKVAQEGPTYALATRGAEGAILYHKGNFYEQNVIETDVIDTMGAGDSFIGGFLLSILEGKSIEEALHFGAKLAAETCKVQGTFGYGIPIQ